MFSSHWPSWAVLLLRAMTFIAGVAAAWVGWRASRLRQDASEVAVADTTPLTQVSWADAPDLGTVEALVAIGAVKAAQHSTRAQLGRRP